MHQKQSDLSTSDLSLLVYYWYFAIVFFDNFFKNYLWWKLYIRSIIRSTIVFSLAHVFHSFRLRRICGFVIIISLLGQYISLMDTMDTMDGKSSTVMKC